MGLIKLLDAGTANKIAAGEIVASPASVVKELVENSIDAGSKRIVIEVHAGGLELIKVSDNGAGILPEDLEIAFQRHATSKISSIDDLEYIRSLGFRGEALASIASVAKVAAFSRVKGAQQGFRFEISGGEPVEMGPVGCSEGTTMEVRDLFFNTPARRKFLKNPAREAYAVGEVLSRIALGYPEIAFTLISQGNTVLETPGSGDLLEAVASVLGMDTAKKVVLVEAGNALWQIRGYVSKPFFNRSTRKHQFFYINRRWIANKNLRFALDSAFYGVIPKGRYPLAVIHISCTDQAKGTVDVNTDPTKNTVRIEDEKSLLDLVISGVKHKNLSGEADAPGAAFRDSQEKPFSRTYEAPSSAESPLIAVREERSQLNFRSPDVTVPEPAHNSGQHESREEASEIKLIGQYAASFILFERERKLLIADQHAAHERVQYERLLNRGLGDVSQMIVPVTVELNPSQMLLLGQMRNELECLGFVLEPFGGNSIAVRGIPTIFSPEAAIGQLVEDLLDHLVEGTNFEDKKRRLYMDVACKASVTAGQVLTKDEMVGLLTSLYKCRNPMTCPHGRPAIISFSLENLLKEFERK